MTPSHWQWGSLGGRDDVIMVISNSVVQPVSKSGILLHALFSKHLAMKMYTSSTAPPVAPTSRANPIQKLVACFTTITGSTPSYFLNYCTVTVLPALSALRQIHTCSNSNASTAKPMAYALGHTSVPTSGTISLKTPCRQPEDMSVLTRI